MSLAASLVVSLAHADKPVAAPANPTPWKAEIVLQIRKLEAAEKASLPKGLFVDCLPEAMPSWMLITHDALERRSLDSSRARVWASPCVRSLSIARESRLVPVLGSAQTLAVPAGAWQASAGCRRGGREA